MSLLISSAFLKKYTDLKYVYQRNTTIMIITPDIKRRRGNMRIFIAEYHKNTVEGELYRRTLQNDGRDAAEALHRKAREILERNASKAFTDIYGNPLEDKIPLITGVSVKNEFVGKVYWLPEPFRHHHVLRSTAYKKEVSGKSLFPDQQGFIVDNTYHVDRRQGLIIARAAKQLNNRALHSDELYSENVWAAWDDSEGPELVDKRLKIINL